MSTTEPELLEMYEGTRHALEEAQATIDRQAALIGELREVLLGARGGEGGARSTPGRYGVELS